MTHLARSEKLSFTISFDLVMVHSRNPKIAFIYIHIYMKLKHPHVKVNKIKNKKKEELIPNVFE